MGRRDGHRERERRRPPRAAMKALPSWPKRWGVATVQPHPCRATPLGGPPEEKEQRREQDADVEEDLADPTGEAGDAPPAASGEQPGRRGDRRASPSPRPGRRRRRWPPAGSREGAWMRSTGLPQGPAPTTRQPGRSTRASRTRSPDCRGPGPGHRRSRPPRPSAVSTVSSIPAPEVGRPSHDQRQHQDQRSKRAAPGGHHQQLAAQFRGISPASTAGRGPPTERARRGSGAATFIPGLGGGDHRLGAAVAADQGVEPLHAGRGTAPRYGSPPSR